MRTLYIVIIMCLVLTGCHEETRNEDISSEPSLLSTDGTYDLSGFIGDDKINMNITISEGKFTGNYEYNNYSQNIETGFINGGNFSLFSVAVDEMEKFFGMIEVDLITGIWIKEEEMQPFVLSTKEVGNSLPPPTGNILNMDGDYYGVDGTYYANTSIKFTPVSDTLLYFYMQAFNGTSEGMLRGVAKFDGQASAVFTVIDNSSNQSIDFIFSLKSDEITLDTTDYRYDCGNAVEFSKFYSKQKIEPPDTLDFLTEEQNDSFKKLTGNNFIKFIDNSQRDGSCENLDTFDADIFTLGIRGYPYCGIIMINSTTGTIMAAVISNGLSGYYYFSNDLNYKEPPVTISEFMNNEAYELMTTIG